MERRFPHGRESLTLENHCLGCRRPSSPQANLELICYHAQCLTGKRDPITRPDW